MAPYTRWIIFHIFVVVKIVVLLIGRETYNKRQRLVHLKKNSPCIKLGCKIYCLFVSLHVCFSIPRLWEMSFDKLT